MGKKIFVTSALPYANGPIHIGHLVEYIQTDIFVRFLKLKKEDVLYICADDAHGAPIEINAMKEGIAPEELVKKYFEEHTADFKEFLIDFDNFYTTNSPENKQYSDLFFAKLKEKGLIYQKEIQLNYCEHDKRFLPDRYVKGICPRCKSPDQYGDVCEKCNATYQPTDLIDPRCVICGNTPIRKTSRHYFFKLSIFSKKLKDWLVNSDGIQPEVKNFVLNWINAGLQDWCISRDGPYFGFKIPGETDKYYYVWLDAPIGYFASLANYASRHNIDVNEYLTGKNSDLIHFIGKDIIYFHLLFWPAMLMAADFNLPSKIIVHGFLTVNKEKMSKSRGTFLTARDYLNALNPEFLRFYYAGNLTNKLEDIDLDWADFQEKINSELVSNIANFTYRVLSFCHENFDGKIIKGIVKKEKENIIGGILKNYGEVNYREALKGILQLSTLGNKYFQDNEPWKLIKENKNHAHVIVSECIDIIKDLCILLYPIMPKFSKEIQEQLKVDCASLDDLYAPICSDKIQKPKILLTKLESVIFAKGKSLFEELNLKVGKVLDVSDHPNGEKLYILKIDIGETRQLVAGLKPYYIKDELLNKNLIIVTNLKHAVLRGVESQGMLLAADDGKNVRVLEAPDAKSGEEVFAEDLSATGKKQITFEEFTKIPISAENESAFYENKKLKTKNSRIIVGGIFSRAKVR